MLDFIATTQLEVFVKEYIAQHTSGGKYHGSRVIKGLYYKLKQHNLDALDEHLSTRPLDTLYSKRAKRTKDLGGIF